MQVSCFAVLFQFMVIKIVTARYSIPAALLSQFQINNVPEQNEMQLLTNLLSPSYNELKFSDRLQLLSSAILQMPSKRNGNYLADMLKQSAMQSLTTAAEVCRKNGMPIEYGLSKQGALSRQVALPDQLILPGLSSQLTLPTQVSLPSQVDLTNLIGLSNQSGLSSLRRLSGQNALPLPIARAFAQEILGSFLGDSIPKRTVTIQY